MNRQEAYSILGLSSEAKDEDIKKAFKKLTLKYHPDVNKNPDAPATFLKIKEAFELLSNKRQEINNNSPPENIYDEVSISFKESVLGTKKEIVYNRIIKCEDCDGNGKIPINNGCTVCGGGGRIVSQSQGFLQVQTCKKCLGQVSIQDCKKCYGDGKLKSESKVSVTIPPGIVNGNILRLAKMGNYLGNHMGFVEISTDFFIKILVENNTKMFIRNGELAFIANISLLDAIKGSQIKVESIYGEKTIIVPKLSKHKDEILIPNAGVNCTGNQVVILNIDYPENIDDLVKVLEVKNGIQN